MVIGKLSNNTKAYIDRYYKIIDKIENKMREIKNKNCISKMFIEQMIVLHECGVEMSENILNYTTNSNIEMLAETIVETYNKSIDELNDMLSKCCDCGNNERDVNLYYRRIKNINEKMIGKMKGINIFNNLDVDFLSGMIYQYEVEIAIAKNVLSYPNCDEVKIFAENLITTHELQIRQMRQILRMMNENKHSFVKRKAL